MHKAKNLELMVGLMMLAALGAFFMLALQVSGLQNLYDNESGYKISAEFTNIGSLKVRSKVAISGVPIGRVTEIHLDPNSYYAIVDMEIDEHIKLDEGVEASIQTAGLLGDNYIGMTPGQSLEKLKPGAVLGVESTTSAVVLENLISKFISNSASK